jgi:hypothetical protein
LCLKYIPSAVKRFARIKELREMKLELAKNGRLHITDHAEESFKDDTCRLIEILVGAGLKTDAEKIRDLAAATSDSPDLRDAMSKALSADQAEAT